MDTIRSTETYASCPICSGTILKPLWEVNGYTIARCTACTLVFVQNRVTLEELGAHYSSSGDEAYDDTNADCLNYYYFKLADLIKARFPHPGRILDLGCSRGWFLDAMTGWECHGNEIVPSDAAAARERYGDRIVSGSFDDYPLREDYFDVITLQDVFDHFRDPMPALEKCRKMLKPGGLIVIKVHNISCLYAKLTGKNFYAIIPPSHLFYYDRRTLARALSIAGFRIVDSRFIGHLLKIRTVFWRLSRGNSDSLFYRICKFSSGKAFGEFKIHKNLHDIITMSAVKTRA
ncbi:MAG TPA: class I SAM-dependent methyltransferase [Terracidiphilus sp.]|nr:class I SAM-dependent methyltransferase [Terracidiphilus sp.]